MANIQFETVEPILTSTFGFHPLAIEDAFHESHIPKVDDWQEYLFIVFRAVKFPNVELDLLQVPELDVFLGPNFVVSYHHEPLTAVDKVWGICLKDQRWTKRGAEHLLYLLADELVSEAVTVVDRMYEELEQIEDQLFSEARPVTLERLFKLNRITLQLRRILVPQRDVLNRLARNDYPTIKAEDRVFFRDIYDHTLQLNHLLDDILILVGRARDTYLSIINNRMNDIMKTLTVITALFMPLAFITGFFGMNFFQAVTPLETWTSEISFMLVLAIMLLVPLSMFLWMRHRFWI
jgi:magnesium transporter